MSQWHRKRNVVVSDAFAYWKIQFAIERALFKCRYLNGASAHVCWYLMLRPKKKGCAIEREGCQFNSINGVQCFRSCDLMPQPTRKYTVPLRKEIARGCSRSKSVAEVRVNCNNSAQHWFSFIVLSRSRSRIIPAYYTYGAFCG